MSVGKNLKRLREKAGLTQAELSKQLFVSQQMLGAIEQEIRMPSLVLAGAIANVLGCSIEDLLKDEE